MAKIDCLCQCGHKLFRKIFGASMKNGIFVIGMRIAVTSLNLAPFYVVNYELIEWMKNEMDRYILKFLFNFWMTMTLIAYWTACLRKPKPIP